VLEKSTRMRESLKMMGLSTWVLWLTWYLKQFLFLLITVFFMAALIKVHMDGPNNKANLLYISQVQIFIESDYVLLVVFLLLFVNCLIAFCFLIRYSGNL